MVTSSRLRRAPGFICKAGSVQRPVGVSLEGFELSNIKQFQQEPTAPNYSTVPNVLILIKET